jgi:hypothetical protein
MIGKLHQKRRITQIFGNGHKITAASRCTTVGRRFACPTYALVSDAVGGDPAEFGKGHGVSFNLGKSG